MSKMIKLSDDLGKRYDQLRQRLNYSNNPDFITDICKFFEANSIDLKTENFKSSFNLLEKYIGKRFDQLQSRISIDIKYLNSFDKKLDSFDEVFNEKILKKTIEKNTINEITFDNTDDILKLKKQIEEQEKVIISYKNMVEDRDDQIKEYHRCLKTLNSNMKVDNSITGRRPYINLSVSETEDLFHLIP